MSERPVRLEFTRDRRTATLILDAPPLNLLSSVVVNSLDASVKAIRDSDLRTLVVYGAGGNFSAGADANELRRSTIEEGLGDAKRLAQTLNAVGSLRQIVIAAVDGYALGGGLELALAADFRFVSRDAVLGLPEVRLGLVPGAGGTQRLTRLVGPGIAKDLILTGRHIGAREALDIGLVHRVVAGESALDAAQQQADRFSEAPPSINLAKRAIDEGLDLPLADALELEARLSAQSQLSGPARRLLAKFMEQAEPEEDYSL